jgi:spermidine synthase
LVGPLFFVSGAAALVLESLWIRLFALSFGTTGLAMSTVLTAFMAGLALGGLVGGRMADRTDRPDRLFRAYALMETAIALCAVAMPLFRRLASSVDVSLEAWLAGSMFGLSLGRFAVAFLVLMIPATLMGATLPLLSRAVVGTRGGALARDGGALYAINTWGAVLGAAATPFLLLPAFGVQGTGLAVAAADLTVALAAGFFAFRMRGRSGAGEATTEVDSIREASRSEDEIQSTSSAHLAIVGIGLSGAVAMVYQQVWARVLSLVIGSSVYAISLILALFLLGLALGSAIYSRRTALQPGQPSNLAVMHLFVVVWAALTLYLADQLPAVFVVGLRLMGLGVGTVVMLQVLIVALVVLPPTFFMGMTFPASLRLVELGRPDLGPGRAVGWTYSSNTLGAILGSFLGGFVILPGLGAQSTLLVCSLGSLVLALGYCGLTMLQSKVRRALAPLVAAVVVGLSLPLAFQPWNLSALSSGVFRVSRSGELAQVLEDVVVEDEPEPQMGPALRRWEELARRTVRPEDIWDEELGHSDVPEMLFHQAGITATVAVTETRARSILEDFDWVTFSLRVNGKADASLTVLSGLEPGDPAALSPQGDAETQLLSGALAFLLHSGRPGDALVIGWGSGLTAGAALDTGLDSVRVVEIERQVILGSAPFQPYAGEPLRDRRLDMVEDDGRRLLASRDDLYDLIVSEPSNPWISGCSNLFTVEFFELVESRLRQGGLFLQWVQAYEISAQTMASILAAVRAVFGAAMVFQPAHSTSDLLIVAGREQGSISWEQVGPRLAGSRIGARLRPLGVIGPEDIGARLVLGTADVDRAIRGVERNTDDNLRVELAAPFDLVRHRDASGRQLLAELRGSSEPGDVFLSLPAAVRERLEQGLARVGRGVVTPPVVSAELRRVLATLTPEPARPALERVQEEGGLETLAEALEGSEPSLGLAVLGLAAALDGQERLATLLLLAHLRAAPLPQPEVRALLSRWSLEVGLPARSWSLAHPETDDSSI